MKKRKNPFLVFLCCVLAVPTCAVLTGELTLPADQAAALELLRPWIAVGALLGAAHLLLRPVLRLLSAPLGCLTLGLFGLVIDVALIYGCAYFVEGFAITSWTQAVLAAILVNAMCMIVGRK